MSAFLHNRGYSFNTKIGWLETKILDILQNRIQAEDALLLNACKFGSKYTIDESLKIINNNNFKSVFLAIMADPYINSSKRHIEDFLKEKSLPCYRVGYTDNTELEFDFWAIATSMFFKKYTIEDVSKVKFNKVYLSYNRKPRNHRKILIKHLHDQNLIADGVVTMSEEVGGRREGFNEHNDSRFDVSLNDKDIKMNEHSGLPEDIYTLGILDIWNECFLNVVSETVDEECDHLFVSEKIWKPILGLRPFVINGQKGLYNWLEKRGFYTFEDYWKHIDLRNGNTQENICNVIRFLKKENLNNMYKEMHTKLLHNRNMFFNYSKKELIKVFKFPKLL
jgi:hypothetical protein